MWPFRRKPAPPPPPSVKPFLKPDDQWAVGDLAQCIAAGWIIPINHVADAPKRGDILIVKAINVSTIYGTHIETVGLGFANYPHWWVSNCFRKLKPCADELDRKAADKIRPRRRLRDLHDAGNRHLADAHGDERQD